MLVFEAEEFQHVEVQPVFHAAAGFFAGDDVAKVGDGEDVFVIGAGFGFGEAFDAIGGKDEIEIKGAIFELHESLATDDLELDVVVGFKSHFEQGRHHAATIFLGFGGKGIHIVGGAGVAQEDGRALGDK